MKKVDDFLAHYGVKGMKWGVRKADRPVQAVAVKSHPTARKIKTTGGANHPASPEALRAAMIRQQAKKSRVHSLSNKDLQDAITRMNLEQNFNRLNQAHASRGRKVVNALMGSLSDQHIDAIASYAGGQAGSRNPNVGKRTQMGVEIGARTARSMTKGSGGGGGSSKKKR